MLLAPRARLVMQIKPPQQRASEQIYVVGLENSHDKFARTSAWCGGSHVLGQPLPAHTPPVPRVCNWLPQSLTHPWDWRKVALLSPENAQEQCRARQDDGQRQQMAFHAWKKGVIPWPGSGAGSS